VIGIANWLWWGLPDFVELRVFTVVTRHYEYGHGKVLQRHYNFVLNGVFSIQANKTGIRIEVILVRGYGKPSFPGHDFSLGW
jgi:hypothetical protein